MPCSNQRQAFITNLVRKTYKSWCSEIINTHYLHKKVEDFILNSQFKKIVTLGYRKTQRNSWNFT